MGYTTKFSGAFKLDRQLTPEHAEELHALVNYDDRPSTRDGQPDAYCQWRPTRTLTGIEWDQNEKFYKYVEWLQFIVDRKLTPWGYTLTGSVEYQGETIGDCGLLVVEDGKVCQREKIVDLTDLDVLADAIIEVLDRTSGHARQKAAVVALLQKGRTRSDLGDSFSDAIDG